MVAIFLAGGDGGGGDLPRLIRLIYVFTLAITSALTQAQQIGGDIHEAFGASVSEYGKNHLKRGSIRPLFIHGAYVGRDTSALRHRSSAEAKFGTRHQLPTAAASDMEPSGHWQLVALPQHLPTSAADATALNPALAAVMRRRSGSREASAPPTAIAPPALSASEEQAESTAAEALTRSAAVAQPVHISTKSQPVVLPHHYSTTSSAESSHDSSSATLHSLSTFASSSAEVTRPQQPLAKWRKIGPLIDRRGGSSAFQRMRLVKQHFLPDGLRENTQSIEESANTTTVLRQTTSTQAPLRFTVASSSFSSASYSSSTPKIVALAQHVPTQDDDEASSFRATTRAAVMAAAAAAAADNDDSTQRRYRQQKPHIKGPLLVQTEDLGSGIVHSSYSGSGGPISSIDVAPRIYENPTSSAEYAHEASSLSDDYHHRRSIQVDRRFKLSPSAGGKVGYRPRLRIRRPDEQPQQAAAGATIFEPPSMRTGTGAPSPIRLPQLTPFQAESPPPLRQIANAPAPPTSQFQRQFIIEEPTPPADGGRDNRNRGNSAEERSPPPNQVALPTYGGGGGGGRFVVQPVQRFVNSANGYVVSTTLATVVAPEQSTTPHVPSDGENYGSVGEQPPQPSPQRASAGVPDSASTDSGLAFANIGPLPPGISAEAFGLSDADAVKYGIQSTDASGENELHSAARRRTEPAPSVTRRPPPPAPKPAPAPPVVAAADATFVIPENSGLRPVKPPSELQGGFGSSSRSGPFGGGFGGGGGGAIESFGGGGGKGSGLPTNHVQVEPPTRPASGGGGRAAVEGQPKEEDFFTGESALSPNRRGPTGDGYGPPVLEGAAVPPLAPPGPVNYGGAAAGIRQPPSPRQEPLSTDDAEPAMSTHTHQQHQQPFLMETAENQPTTVKPSALLSILNRADEGFNQVISHFEAGTPIEAAAIDVLEVALGSQKLDSQAKLLSHVDRTVGLDNLQRLQRWANTGGALDMLKEQFAKMAKNYKPPPETKAFTIPPQLEYLFQPGSSGGGGRR